MTSIRPDGRVEFRFFRPNAVEVKVLGTFNQWAGDSIVMQSEADGWWSATASIAVGEHRFRYWADGQWYTDFAAYGVESGKLGWNSVLLITRAVAPVSTKQRRMVLQQQFDEYPVELKSAA